MVSSPRGRRGTDSFAISWPNRTEFSRPDPVVTEFYCHTGDILSPSHFQAITLLSLWHNPWAQLHWGALIWHKSHTLLGSVGRRLRVHVAIQSLYRPGKRGASQEHQAEAWLELPDPVVCRGREVLKGRVTDSSLMRCVPKESLPLWILWTTVVWWLLPCLGQTDVVGKELAQAWAPLPAHPLAHHGLCTSS